MKTIDFEMGWAGPRYARALVDFGTDLVKIESRSCPKRWHKWNAGGVNTDTLETQLDFCNGNRNKRSAAIEFDTAHGREQPEALIAEADVAIENCAARVLDRLDIGPSVQRRLKLNIVSLMMDGERPALPRPAPLLGEHDGEILARLAIRNMGAEPV